ncbi:SusC/RagA family TonB-linked outer membrane protein [Flavobacterium aestivum]|uniref:SusC/RagA family TonB-linked outer membrane protein n=1 Tax=Flavobacterium aestivum TaxID=3003257 RepID=UPI0022859B91|nr:SusC/RagA family TonB-linked outer membrane protein [Flavobacterium aestivum]
MKLNLNKISVLLLVLVAQITFAQERTVSGIVSDNAGIPLPGVSVLIKGTKTGTQTDFDGSYSIKAEPSSTIIFSYVGLTTKEVSASSTKVNVKLSSNSTELQSVVVTALGIKREKKSLGYATQQIKGDDLTKVITGNLANSLSGKLSGVAIKTSGNIGGSTNVLIRGIKSLTGNNQPLWVVDGIPLNNDNTNSRNQTIGIGGFDYGNSASDINPDDIETMNVLKGTAASALYGSRAAGGVIIVTTKKGSKSKGLGVTVDSGITIGHADKSTLPHYQTQYGAGYDSTLYPNTDINNGGSYPVAPTEPDQSWGAPFNPNQLVYQWNSFYPTLPTYGKATPWVAAKHSPVDFFVPSTTYTNNVAIAAGNDKGNFRLAYSKFDQTGILPNSHSNKDNFNFSSSYNLSSKTTINATANYAKTGLLGSNETGYGSGGNNIMTSFRQWWETNVDIKDLKNAYNITGQNTSWNITGPDDFTINYHDNPYYQRYNNYNTMDRDRFFGNFGLTSELAKWLSVTAKGSIDTYSQIQEERVAVGSMRANGRVGFYSVFDKSFSEYNTDLIFNFKTNITENLTFAGILGGNIRRSNTRTIFATTNGGLATPGIYSLNNSKLNILFPAQSLITLGTNSIYESATFGYLNTFFIEGTFRTDASSTLPSGSNVYSYPSISGSYIFSNSIDADWLTYGKIRANYAETGSDASFAQIQSTYDRGDNFGSTALFSNENTKKNQDLKSELTKGTEIGLEMAFFKRRVGFDVSYYKTNTTNQVMNVIPTAVTGYTGKVINSGDIQNEGFEVSLNGTIVQTKDFSWDARVNWSNNKSTVVSLSPGINSVTIGTFNLNTSVVAEVGQPYGLIKGSGYVYSANGERIVQPDGNYASRAGVTIGDINPDWIGGINNSFKYKNLSLSFLIDVKKGGDVFSLDQAYGQGSGLYDSTVGTNDRGFPIRNTLANGGGQILPGVQQTTNADGSVTTTPNTVYAAVTTDDGYSNLGNNSFPTQAFVYDASYVKLREVSLSYRLPSSILHGTPFNDVNFTVNGNNLWIISKNLPDADPEAGFSSGNFQGVQTGVMPTVREISFNVKLQF